MGGFQRYPLAIKFIENALQAVVGTARFLYEMARGSFLLQIICILVVGSGRMGMDFYNP